ncbi:MAG: DUF3450 family protein [Planctomycetota bacterium]
MDHDIVNFASGRSRRPAAGFVVLPAVLAVICAAGHAQDKQDTSTDKPAISVEETRASLEKWVDLRRTISQEKRDWAVGKELLVDRSELVKREIETLRKKIADAEASLAEADRKKSELTVTRDHLRDGAAALDTALRPAEKRTLELLKAVPEKLSGGGNLRAFSQRIPTEDGPSKLSLGERYQNLIAVLNSVNAFEHGITKESEVRMLADGTNAEVTVVYLGLGQAFYVNSKGDGAGVGSVAADKWVWKARNDAAAQVASVVAVLKNEKPAEFVRVPVEIK